MLCPYGMIVICFFPFQALAPALADMINSEGCANGTEQDGTG